MKRALILPEKAVNGLFCSQKCQKKCEPPGCGQIVGRDKGESRERDAGHGKQMVEKRQTSSEGEESIEEGFDVKGCPDIEFGPAYDLHDLDLFLKGIKRGFEDGDPEDISHQEESS